ncbi:restriction endonuclease type II-like protein [Scheffersomyces coipomensis]|uniref:restriction endonuclease type II-like protein n=1 Tax=Scheffersomyces coipomensis TaxID=1788519 RepID=UPI00315D9EF6
MSDNTNKKDDQVDSTSFASILAGVQRMREQFGVVADDHEQESIPQREHTSAISKPPITTTSTTASTSTTTISRPSTIESNIPPTTTVRSTLSTITGNPIPANTDSPSPSSTPGPSTVRSSRTVQNIAKTAKVLVHPSQKGNPLLSESLLKSIGYEFNKDVLCDYFINSTFQILFLSLKYHKLKPEYLWSRLKKMNRGSSSVNTRNDRALRMVLIVVDIEAPQEQIRNLSDFCIKHDLTMVLAWTFEEAGNYVAFSKQLDNAPAKTKQGIQGIRGSDYKSCVVEALTGIRSVNKTDVSNLLANYESIKNIVSNTCMNDNITNVSGMGATKVRNMRNIFSEPFIYNKIYEPLEE